MRTRLYLLAALLIAAACLSGGNWVQQQQTAARRLAAWEEQQAAIVEPEALDQVITLESRQMTLAEFAALIESQSGLDVEIDAAEIGRIFKGKTPENIKFRVPSGSISLRAALRNALAPLRLGAEWRGSSLVITTYSAAMARERLLTVVYPLPQPEPAGMHAEAWTTTLAAYANYGGGHIEPVPGAVVVVTTVSGHRRIRQVIDAICSLGGNSPEPAIIPPPEPGDMEQRILAALAEPTQMEFVETPLQYALAYLSDLHDIPLVPLVPQLNSAGLGVDVPVTKFLKGISLRSALRLMLIELDLTFVIRDQALLITTIDDAESYLEQKAYPLGDLVGVNLERVAYPVGDLVQRAGEADILSLADFVTSTISPASWDRVGGPGTCRVVSGDWLLVSQSSFVHEQVQSLLRETRLALHPDAPRSRPIVPQTSADRKIIAALEQPCVMEFVEAPLKDAVRYLQDALQIPTVLNVKTLNDAGINIDWPVTFHLRSGRTATQLEIMLEQLDLTYVLRDEVLQITTPDDAESQLYTRLFNVRALAGIGLSAERLCSLVPSVCRRGTWDREGGPGSAVEFRGLLVVSQTQVILDEVEQLLVALEKHCVPREPETQPLMGIPLVRSPARLATENKLAQTANRKLSGTLEAALETLEIDLNLPLVLDIRSLVDGGIDRRQEVSAATEELPLTALLDKLLQPVGLVWLIRDDVVFVTTPETAERLQELRLYWIGNLAADELAVDVRHALIQALPDAWTEPAIGGGRILSESAVEAIDGGWLIVRASQPRHRRVEAWLAGQRTTQTRSASEGPHERL